MVQQRALILALGALALAAQCAAAGRERDPVDEAYDSLQGRLGRLEKEDERLAKARKYGEAGHSYSNPPADDPDFYKPAYEAYDHIQERLRKLEEEDQRKAAARALGESEEASAPSYSNSGSQASQDADFYKPAYEAYDHIQERLRQLDEEEQAKAAKEAAASGATEPQGAPRPLGFGNHLRDLSKVGKNTAQRAYQEAKPALSSIRGDLGEVMNRVKTNPHVVKVVEATKPRVMQVVNKANGLASKAQQRFQARREARRQAQADKQNAAPPAQHSDVAAAAAAEGQYAE